MEVTEEREFAGELQAAEDAARRAGDVIMALYGKDYAIRDKGKGDPVTAADLEANAKIRQVILGRYPGDGWLSEEDKDSLERLRQERVWVVDPIDGTKEFIQCVPQFAISIALVVGGRPVVSVVYNPAADRLFRAIRGRGAALNGAPIRVSARGALDGSLLLISRSEPSRRFRRFADRCRLQPLGSIAYRLAMVGAGEGDATVTLRSIHDWDVCAGALVVEEAGGTVIDGGGNGLVFNREPTWHRGLIAANESLARSLQGLVAEALAERS
jgi:myo-inositol-1(or 4)-monophosphatase